MNSKVSEEAWTKNGWSGNDVKFYPGANGILQSKLTKHVLNHRTVDCQRRDEHLASSDISTLDQYLS